MGRTTLPTTVALSRGRKIDLSQPNYYRDLLTTIAQEILYELSEIEKVDLTLLDQEAYLEVIGITQIRLLNELYFCLGQLKGRGMELDVKQAIEDLRDIWNSYIDKTNRPAALKFQVEPEDLKRQ
ncbi:MAG: hypothetical protein JRI57_05285 [Deltaproteobacteria bacterium]|nr:hypothetical protein [Deltaproteobacteria bacterium]MBW1953095.1 hypothetical protein [Deltaproteobacteria bacterium]MBW1987191.1 hypothetical protein [Deltaproteobacteria bacterium]MBW2135053.1 hypothetical protein [Deltaproteobacteria bacterium]